MSERHLRRRCRGDRAAGHPPTGRRCSQRAGPSANVPMPVKSLSELMGDAARELQHQSDAAETMQTAVEVAVREMDGADGAALSIILRGGKVQTLEASSD